MATNYTISSYLRSQQRFLQEEADTLAAAASRIAALGGRLSSANIAARVVAEPIPKTNFKSTTDGLLAGLVFGGQVIGYERLEVGALPVGLQLLLTDSDVGENATKCRVYVESVGAANPTKAIRYRQDGQPPSAILGLALGDGGVADLDHRLNMDRLLFVATEPGKTHIVHIEYRA